MKQASTQKRLIARLLILAAMGLVAWFIWRNQSATSPETTSPTRAKKEQSAPAKQKGVPQSALKVLDYIRKNGEAPKGYVGGRTFENREKRLPQKDDSGKKIKYSEWDTNPKVSGKNRGPERLVTGSDHSAYYTKDHYKTFQKIE